MEVRILSDAEREQAWSLLDASAVVCLVCGSPEVQVPEWTDPNRNTVVGGEYTDHHCREGYCTSCYEHGAAWSCNVADDDVLARMLDRDVLPLWEALARRKEWSKGYDPQEWIGEAD